MTASIGGARVVALNEHDDVLGASYKVSPEFSGDIGVLYRNGQPELLPAPAGLPEVVPADLNDARLIVGSARSQAVVKPVYWRNGAVGLLNMNGATRGLARAVNNRGQIIGELSYADHSDCVLWNDYAARPVVVAKSANGTSCGLVDINARGDVIGYVRALDMETRAVIWRDGRATNLQAPGTGVSVVEINEAGEIAGYFLPSSAPSDVYPVRWKRDLTLEVFSKTGSASSINARSDVAVTTYDRTINQDAYWVVDKRGNFHRVNVPLNSLGLKINNGRTLAWTNQTPNGPRAQTCQVRF